MADESPFSSETTEAFSDQAIRRGFIRKVYAILVVQLAITLTGIVIFIYVKPVRDFSQNNQWVYLGAIILTFVMVIALGCFENIRRGFPTNMICLMIFTVAEAFVLGSIASYYTTDSVLMAVGITAVVALALTIFAFQTKIDFTLYHGLLFVLLIVLLCFGFLAIFVHNRILDLVYAGLGALIFSAYLVVDTQLMIGGQHKYSISPEEYVFGALNLYLDIVNLFLFILRLTGKNN